MLILMILMSNLGLMSVLRTIRHLFRTKLVSKNEFVFLGMMFALIITIENILVSGFLIHCVLTICFCVFAMAIVPQWAEWRCRNHFKACFGLILSETILSMKAGDSFRTSLKISCHRFSNTTLGLSDRLWQIIELAKPFHQGPEWYWLQSFLRELVLIDQQNQSALDRMQSLRSIYMSTVDFEAAVKSATTQARLQIWVVSCLFICLQIGSWYLLAGRNHLNIFFYGNILFVLGLFWQKRISRRPRWNI